MKSRDESQVKRALRLLLVAVWAAAAAGCALLPEPKDASGPSAVEAGASAEALAVLQKLAQANAPLKTFKGIGRLTIRKEGKLQLDGRVAWVGADPRRLSVVLSASGFPALRLASDGEWLYYQDPQDASEPVKRLASADPDLERLLSIPITAGDIITLLCGRMPLKEHRSAKLQAAPSGDARVLVLSRIWGVQQRVYLDAAQETARATELYDASGKLVYQAHFMEMQKVGPYRVPLRLAVLNGERTELQLVVENYWADIPVTPSMFVLPPPG